MQKQEVTPPLPNDQHHEPPSGERSQRGERTMLREGVGGPLAQEFAYPSEQEKELAAMKDATFLAPFGCPLPSTLVCTLTWHQPSQGSP
jgi:hypothetical protein